MSLALKPIILVFLGGGLGSVLRLFTFHACRLFLPASFPWGTFVVNVAGGVLAGAIAGALVVRNIGGADAGALFLLTGVMGGFTTFSAFSLDAMHLWQRGESGVALAYVASSVILSVAGAVGGFACVRAFA